MFVRHLSQLTGIGAVCTAILLGALAPCAAEPVLSGKDKPKAEGWKKTTVVKGLENPWGLVFLPDGNMLVTERPGRIRLIEKGKLVEEPISGAPDVMNVGQGGLFDISLHPNFAENNYVYLTYAAGTRDKNRTTLARGVLDGKRLRDLKVLFEVEPVKSGGQHFGAPIIWLPDGTLLFSTGDGGNPPQKIQGVLARDHGQKLDSHLAKTIRLKDDGSVPDDNPFKNKENAKPEIYSYGHRNIQGLARDPESGRIWSTEHGPKGGDELNLIKAGENYGWPKASHGRDYRTGELITPKESLPGMVDPKLVWIPSQGASGLAFYTGDKFPDWRGSLFSGGLPTKEIRRIKLDGDKVTGEESLPIGQRVRDVVQGPDGFLYVLTDEDNGELLRIEPE